LTTTLSGAHLSDVFGHLLMMFKYAPDEQCINIWAIARRLSDFGVYAHCLLPEQLQLARTKFPQALEQALGVVMESFCE
jgi:hypothetical protein